MCLFENIMYKIQKIFMDNLQILTTTSEGAVDASIFTEVSWIYGGIDRFLWYHMQQGVLIQSRKIE